MDDPNNKLMGAHGYCTQVGTGIKVTNSISINFSCCHGDRRVGQPLNPATMTTSDMVTVLKLVHISKSLMV